eukprot:CAMPEP_0117500442 /NCGR_PEP_ID=MMETSP0784-20121206/22778_1 /TAXON_ID=39447 /ORGANISM="" /LENGTH=147 /DNA_ID=CAMNT_0005295651 /DNA_START=94 /DNA_END=537 /DNA_ORIENTATION=+
MTARSAHPTRLACTSRRPWTAPTARHEAFKDGALSAPIANASESKPEALRDDAGLLIGRTHLSHLLTLGELRVAAMAYHLQALGRVEEDLVIGLFDLVAPPAHVTKKVVVFFRLHFRLHTLVIMLVVRDGIELLEKFHRTIALLARL